jgi:hypothetical protein
VVALSVVQKREFAEAIAAFVPDQMLASVVREQKVVQNFDEIGKSFAGPVEGRSVAIAQAVVDKYDEGMLFDRLAQVLYDRMIWEPRFLTIAAPLILPDDQNRKQAFLARRDNLLVAAGLQAALSETLPRICCIAGEYDLAGNTYSPVGTGFLVGTDLVLTAAHVFEPLVLVDPARVPDCFMIFFDHVGGEPILRPDDRRKSVRRVKLTPGSDWLIEHRRSFPEEGRIRDPSEVQVTEMKNQLDFALVKLAEPVGLESVSPWGGARRSWVKLSAADPAARLAEGSRIVIPQHPSGEPRSIDFGRFQRMDASGTRIRYDTGTLPGTSGAPCFNRDFKIVGIHNAEFNPNRTSKPEANQAVLFDAIEPLVKPHIGAVALQAPSRLWNLSQGDEEFRLIIGRAKFLDWLAASKSVSVNNRADRIYAAVAPAAGAGKTFTTEILAFSLAEHTGYSALVMGNDKERLPSALGDFVRVLAARLKVPAAELSSMPERPDATLPAGSVDGDKLRRWASVLLPNWFVQVLERNRVVEIDRAEEARKFVEQAAKFNVEVSDEVATMAASTVPLPAEHEHWVLAWIALDSLPETTIPSEIKDFIAALAGAGRDEASMPAVLRRLRWLFLGYRPDFLAEAEAAVEILDPANITTTDVSTLLDSAVAAGRAANPVALERFGKAVLAVSASAATSGVDQAVRMKQIQHFAGMMLPLFFPKEDD